MPRVPIAYTETRATVASIVMGKFTSYEAFALRWAELRNDPALRDLPYKIELNAFGKIEMSPASNRHARLQAFVTVELARQLPDGVVFTECPIFTVMGVRVPDVAWASAAFLDKYGETTPFPQAPEICVEIVSPSNSDEELAMKTRAYLAAGAVEVWLVSEDGACRIVDAAGARSASSFAFQWGEPPARRG